VDIGKQEQKMTREEKSASSHSIQLTKTTTGEDRRMILKCNERMTISAKPNQEIAGIINRALFQAKAPAFARVYNVYRNGNESVTIITIPAVTAKDMISYYGQLIVNAAKGIGRAIQGVKIFPS
jgi:hypothetical protein